MKNCILLLVLLATSFALAQQPSIGSNGNNNVNVNINNGIIQVNPDVTSGTKAELKAQARKQFGRADNWRSILVPAHDAVKVSACKRGVPAGALTVMLGAGLVSYCTDPNCSMNLVSSPTENYLSVSRKGKSLKVEAKLFDRDGRILTEIKDNKVYINKNDVFRWSRPDPHTLTVTDQEDRNALSLRFANKDAVYVEGRFFTRSHDLCIIDKTKALCGSTEISGCAGNDLNTIVLGR
jgi:hypothetical protein